MKIKSTLIVLVGLIAAFSATAQKVENDDMYFTSKDRVKVKAAAVQVNRSPETKPQAANAVAEPVVGINPTDSYSARNVNPEYSTSSNTEKDTKSTTPYFVENYAPTGVNSNLKGNYSTNSYSNTYNNPYTPNYSPYSRYGNMGWSNPYMSMGGYPYYGSSMALTYGYGNPYNPWGYNPWAYGGAAYGYGNVWSSPWAMYDPFYDPFYSGVSSCFSFYGYNSFGYNGYGYGGGNYGYPGSVVVIDNDGVTDRSAAYQKRIDRTSSRMQADGTSAEGLTRGGAISSGRVSADNSEPYYQRGWRSNLNNANNGNTSSRTQWYSSGTDTNGGNTGTNWNNNSRSSLWDNGATLNSGGSQSQSRSSWSPSDGGGSRSSGSSAGSTGGGGGHSRGRD